MRFNRRGAIPVAFALVTLGIRVANAQFDPWNTYADFDSASRCAVVNASNAELVVSSVTGQLILVSATDVTLQGTFVDADGFVFFEGESFGLIGFDEDGDGFRTLWWLTLTGTVIEIDSLTAVPSATPDRPEDFHDVPCDACDFWDDSSVCEEPTVTVPLCGVDVPITLPMIEFGLGLMGFVQRGRFAHGSGRGLAQTRRSSQTT